MIHINRFKVDTISKTPNAKRLKGVLNRELYKYYAYSIVNMQDYTSNYCSYEMAHWINNTDRWINNASSTNTFGYKRGTILLVDLGAKNFKYEPSFSHPAVVISQNKNFICIVPCSSKKYGLGYPEIIDATTVDGFSKDTGIQTNALRWISKNRVISKYGDVSSRVLNEIDKKILELIPRCKKNLETKDQNIATLNSTITDLETKNMELENLCNELSDKIKALESKLIE